MSNARKMLGRRTIYTDAAKIDKTNVVQILKDSLPTHSLNQSDIDFLFQYWKGDQPIRNREKKIRPEVNNKIVVNRANEIVAFKVGYVFGEPIQYVSRKQDSTDNVAQLNDIMFSNDKEALDKELAEWFSIAGIAYRMVLPNKQDGKLSSPISIYTLDPRYCFVIHSNALGEPPIMAVKFVTLQDERVLYSVYTARQYYEILEDKIIKQKAHSLGYIPIIEYYTSNAKLGEFEKVIDMLDAINLTVSDRVNGVEQFVQSLMKFVNADINEEDFLRLKDLGAIKIKSDSNSPADVEFMTQELNQTQIQVVIDDMYQTILTICGMPNRNGGSSTSDTGSAVALRDGWESAEARAKDVEVMFKRSEKRFLHLVLRIIRDMSDISMELSDIEIKFTRRNYENISEKSNVLTSLLNCNKIHPRLAFEHSGMFNDVESAYKMSENYAVEQEKKAMQIAQNSQKDGTANGNKATGTEDTE